MQSLSSFLSCLPGIMPRKTRCLILEGNLLSKEESEDIYSRSDSLTDTVLVIGPEAAAAILKAYDDGRLPMKKNMKPTSAPDARSYLKRSDELRKEINERKRKELAVKNPSLFEKSDLGNRQLMDRVFFENLGQGPGSLVLAGITVHKNITQYKSNSGKSSGYHVRFDWTDSDGKPQCTECTPPEANNRRNDPNRKWGLPE